MGGGGERGGGGSVLTFQKHVKVFYHTYFDYKRGEPLMTMWADIFRIFTLWDTLLHVHNFNRAYFSCERESEIS